MLSLVQSNTAEVIEHTTKKACTVLCKSKNSHPDAIPALKILVGLKGVGPATASLLLSVLQPVEIPFFSDELFRWCVWDEEVGGAKEGKGWQRKIRYNLKEYDMLLERVKKLGPRLRKELGQKDTTASAVDIERVAWVLGKEGVDVGVQDDEGEDEGLQADEKKEKQEDEKEKKKKKEKKEEEEEEEEEEEDVPATKENDGDEEKVKKLAAKKGVKRKASEAKQSTEGTRRSMRTRK